MQNLDIFGKQMVRLDILYKSQSNLINFIYVYYSHLNMQNKKVMKLDACTMKLFNRKLLRDCYLLAQIKE